MSVYEFETQPCAAVLDDAHIGDIKGALGTIKRGDHGPRNGWRARLMTLLAILGPGLIVMVGDNDAGAFGTYTQAGQNTAPYVVQCANWLLSFCAGREVKESWNRTTTGMREKIFRDNRKPKETNK